MDNLKLFGLPNLFFGAGNDKQPKKSHVKINNPKIFHVKQPQPFPGKDKQPCWLGKVKLLEKLHFVFMEQIQ